MHLTPSFLRSYVELNPDLVQMRESRNYPGLFVLKYKRNVFYDNLWDDVLRECRGLVIDANYNIIVHPFTKVFNRGENDTDIPLDEDVTIVEKVNGFMAAVTFHPDHGVIVSTTGSLDSDHVRMAREYLEWPILYLESMHTLADVERPPRMTMIFEICHPDDPHIIKEEYGAYLIGARQLEDSPLIEANSMLSEQMLNMLSRQMNASLRDESYWDRLIGWNFGEKEFFPVRRPKVEYCKFSDALERVRHCQHEGFMVYGENTALKLKSPFYKTSKLLARAGDVTKLVGPQAKQRFDEEYYPLIENISQNLEEFTSLDEQERLQYVIEFLDAEVA